MSKLANPWKCDASGCGMLRANDTNHWLLLYTQDADRSVTHEKPAIEVVISPWDERLAEFAWVKHSCGIDCGLKVAAQLIVSNFFRPEISSAGKEAADGA